MTIRSTRARIGAVLLGTAGFFLAAAPLVVSAKTGELLTANCALNRSAFNRDWERYSDIDDRIPVQSRSREAQQVNRALASVAEKRLEIFVLKRDLEIDRQTRLLLRDYRTALKKGLQVNLLKAFWRLAYITFDTVHGTPGLGEGALGTGKSFVKIFSDEAVPIQRLASTLKVLRDMTPGDSRAAIDTEKMRGKIQAVGTTAALDILDTLGDPKEVGKSVAQDIVKQTLPSADITPEEVEILRTEHLTKKALDDALKESYRQNRERKSRVKKLTREISVSLKEANRWKQKEKSRVASLLEKNCKDNKDKTKERERESAARTAPAPARAVAPLPARRLPVRNTETGMPTTAPPAGAGAQSPARQIPSAVAPVSTPSPAREAPTAPQQTRTSCQKDYDTCADAAERLLKQYFKRQKEIADAGRDTGVEPYRSELERLWEQKSQKSLGCIDQYLACCKTAGVTNPSRNRNYCAE